MIQVDALPFETFFRPEEELDVSSENDDEFKFDEVLEALFIGALFIVSFDSHSSMMIHVNDHLFLSSRASRMIRSMLVS